MEMHLAPHDGQKSRRLQLNVTSLWWLQSRQRRRKKPRARMPQSWRASNLSFTNFGSRRLARSQPMRECGGLLLSQAVQSVYSAQVAPVVDRGAVHNAAGGMSGGH